MRELTHQYLWWRKEGLPNFYSISILLIKLPHWTDPSLIEVFAKFRLDEIFSRLWRYGLILLSLFKGEEEWAAAARVSIENLVLSFLQFPFCSSNERTIALPIYPSWCYFAQSTFFARAHNQGIFSDQRADLIGSRNQQAGKSLLYADLLVRTYSNWFWLSGGI